MALFTLFVLAYLAIGVAFFGRRRPGYSHLRHTISELGESGSAYEWQVSYLVFLPVGIGWLMAALFSREAAPGAAVLLTAMGAAYALSAFFPCDPGTPLSGTWKNSIHNLVGGIAYVAMAYQLNELTDGPKEAYFKAALYLLGAFLATFVIGWPKAAIGMLQRLAETSVHAVVVMLLWETR